MIGNSRSETACNRRLKNGIFVAIPLQGSKWLLFDYRESSHLDPCEGMGRRPLLSNPPPAGLGRKLAFLDQPSRPCNWRKSLTIIGLGKPKCQDLFEKTSRGRPGFPHSAMRPELHHVTIATLLLHYATLNCQKRRENKDFPSFLRRFRPYRRQNDRLTQNHEQAQGSP
jgi:hypothetical protein